ncbi:MarR family winged helix-turn-helix transcriptional regulator [Paractinoplanes brasiliensis]|uniref:MarR family winged helix-turn-helix transcriptional regulator n=1 Tax=Paractinoplanes brasiliensis TaxID=52695 RepID=UPI00105E6948|nr:MarR family transcriptional regulator [Actinoplanes brasiliensis]GID30171.1 MarR family transcriptional regulator [Actinoplanes brasiliensis]
MEWPVVADRGTADELAKTLREAIMRLNRRVRQARPVGDLTFSQLSALTSLQLAGALTPRELADVERVQPPTMTKIVGKLEERGLVVRAPHPTDGRQVILSATEQGRAVHAQFEKARNEWLATHLADLTPDERETLAKASEILQKISRA